MKNKQIPLRQFKGLNLPDRKHNLWVYYFTLPTSKQLLSIPSNSKLNAHYSNFNFADVNLKVLVHQSAAIESNPTESLTTLLHFNQPISQHYFKFCTLLLETNAEKTLLTKVINEASVQLIRALLAFNYQFEHELENIKNKKESAFFPFHYLTDFSNLVKVLLMTSNPFFSEFLYLLTPILVLLFSVHEPETIIYESTQKLYTVIHNFLQYHICKEDEILPIISFTVNVSCFNKNNNDKYAQLCQLFSNNRSICPYISAKAYSTFIKRSKFTFDQIFKAKPDEKLFEIGLSIMKALASTLDKKNETMLIEISPSVLSFIEWSINFDHLPEITLPKVEKRSIFDQLEFKTDYQFEFYDLDMFDKNSQEESSGLRSVSPIYLANSIILTSIVGITAEICSKNDRILSEIILNLSRKSIIHLYVTVSIIFLCRPTSVAELLTKTESWDVFVNDSIINDMTLFGREGVDKNVINLKDLILTILFNLSTKDAAVSLCRLIDPNYPTVVFKVVELINMMLTGEFIKQCQESSLFDTLMICYNNYRLYLVKHKNDTENEDMLYMKKSKSLILLFINTFSVCDESKFFIFSNNRRAYFVLSLLFEKHSFEMALDIVCRALETEHVNLLMRHLNKLIKFGFHHLENSNWQELISVLIDCVSVSISVNEKNLMKSFLRSGSIYTFSRIPAAFSEVKSCQRSVRTVFHKIICFFTSLVQNMKNIIFYLSDSQWNFVPNLAKTIRSIEITNESVDLLINFTICSDTLWIKEGVELLMIALEKNDVSQKILTFLVEATKKSIANRYQCFKANVITPLLSFIVNNSNQEELVIQSLHLLRNICSSFFRVGELSLAVRLLSQMKDDSSLLLLDSLLELCEQQSQQNEDHNFSSQMAAIYSTTMTPKLNSAPKAFFHFNPLSVFKVSDFFIPATFNISMKVFFPREYKKMKQLFLVTTASLDQQIVMNVMLNRLIVEIKNKKRENQFQLSNKVKIGQWFDLELALTASTVSLFINSNLETSSVIPKKFRFEHHVLFFIQNIDVDIQSIKIFSKDYYIFSSYDAKIVNEGNVVNLALNSPIPNAEFYGIPVPFCITFVDIIPSCGGPKIFLPLFENTKSADVFKKLLQLLNSLICTREAIFDPSFFRSFAHLLSKTDTNFFTDESLDLILTIYKSIWNSNLRSAMLKFVFGNIDIWSRMSLNSQYKLFSNIFTGLFQIDSTLFVKMLNFHSLLLKFSLFFDSSSNSKHELNENELELKNKIMKETISFLFMISQRSFSPQDAKILTAAAMDINSNDMCVKSLHLIVNLISDNSPGMIAYLKKYSFYQPFISILNSHSEETRIIAINCIYIIQSITKDSLLSDELIDGIRLLNVLDMTKKTLFNIISYMTKSLNPKIFPSITDKVFDFGNLKPIYFPQFLPLFCTVLALANDDERINCLNFIRKSISDYEETRKAFAACNHWIFWLIFLGYVEKKTDDWIDLAELIILTNESVLTNVFNLIMYCDVYGIDASKNVERILSEAIEKKPSPKLALFVIKNILYKAEIIEKEKLNLDDSIHKFCQEFVLAKCPSFTCQYQERELNNTDMKMIISAVKFILLSGLLFGNQQQQPQQTQQQSSDQIKIESSTNLSASSSTLNTTNTTATPLTINPAEFKFDPKNKMEMNIAFICFTICQIAKQNKEESIELSNLFISSIRKLPNIPLIKTEIRKSLLLLYNYYTKNGMKEADSIIYTVRQVDPAYSTIISPEKMMAISESIRESYEKQIPNISNNHQVELNSTIAILHKKANSAIQRVFSEENQKLVELRNNFTKKLANSALEQERFLKGNRKFYQNQLKRMSLQNGGPWFSIPSVPHFKFNFILDKIGRHNKMSVNFHFKDHKMASLLRDTGVESSAYNTNTTTSNNTNNVKIIKGMRIDVSSEVESPNDFTIELECQMVKTAKYFKGKMYLTQSSIYFEVKQTTDAFGEIIDKMSKLIEINVENIKFILKRRYLFIDSACEVFTTYNKSYFFVFASEQNRYKFFKEIESFKLKNIEFIQFGDAQKLFKDLQIQKKWNSGAMTNYEYLNWLNILSGRSIHDISQYPVFPWIISDYTSNELNLQDENSFRDLSKPIGTLNKERLQNLKYLYNETRTAAYACLYRFHYSTPAYVISFLLRNEPFTSLHIQLQNGKFDNPNRLVCSIQQCWESITSVNSDFRELIPEFFATPEFLLNSEHYDLGVKVELVPLKKSSTQCTNLPELAAQAEKKDEVKTAASCQSMPNLLNQEISSSESSNQINTENKELTQNSENNEINENTENKDKSVTKESSENKENTNNNEENTNNNNNSNETQENTNNNDSNETQENTNNNDSNENKENTNNNNSNENKENINNNDSNGTKENTNNNETNENNKESSELNKGSNVSGDNLDSEKKVDLESTSSCPVPQSISALEEQVKRKRYRSRNKVVKGKNGELFVNEETAVDDVILPPWAPSASAFVSINRIALESPYVSSTLHNWIDLIFGNKQRSEESDNLFHPFSYLSTLDEDPSLLPIIQQHAANFGITPFQLFTKPHPKRSFVPKNHVLNSRKQLFFKSVLLQEFSAPENTTTTTTEQSSMKMNTINEDEEEMKQHLQVAREKNKEKVMKIASKSGTFYALFADGSFRSFSFNEKHQLVPQKSSSLEITTHLKQDRVFIDTLNKAIIMSPPWSQSFARIHKTTIFSPRFSHATIVTAISVSNDGCYCVTGAGDASLIVWDLSVFNEEKLQCHVVAHTESISTVAISSVLEVVASCDEGGTLILSDLKTGSFLRKIKFDKPPTRIHVSELGFFVLVFTDSVENDDEDNFGKISPSTGNTANPQASSIGGRVTKAVLVDLGGRIINEVELEGRSTASCVISNMDSTEFVCIAQETKIFYIMRVYDLKIVAMGPVKETVIDISYCKEDLALYLLLDNNSVHLTKLNV